LLRQDRGVDHVDPAVVAEEVGLDDVGIVNLRAARVELAAGG
jgi:hypothetical protein